MGSSCSGRRRLTTVPFELKVLGFLNFLGGVDAFLHEIEVFHRLGQLVNALEIIQAVPHTLYRVKRGGHTTIFRFLIFN